MWMHCWCCGCAPVLALQFCAAAVVRDLLEAGGMCGGVRQVVFALVSAEAGSEAGAGARGNFSAPALRRVTLHVHACTWDVCAPCLCACSIRWSYVLQLDACIRALVCIAPVRLHAAHGQRGAGTTSPGGVPGCCRLQHMSARLGPHKAAASPTSCCYQTTATKQIIGLCGGDCVRGMAHRGDTLA